MIRRQIALELGTVVPIIRLRDNIQLNPNQYIIKIKGIQVAEGEILFDHYMAMNPGFVEEEINGIPTFEPSFHLPAIWITDRPERTCGKSGLYRSRSAVYHCNTSDRGDPQPHRRTFEPSGCAESGQQSQREQSGTGGRTYTKTAGSWRDPEGLAESLVKEGISIRDLLSIFEVLADHAATTRDTDVLTEYVRQGLKRAISSSYFVPNEVTPAITLDPKGRAGYHGRTHQADGAGCISDLRSGAHHVPSWHSVAGREWLSARTLGKTRDRRDITDRAYVFQEN